MDGSHRFVITTTKDIAAIALDIEKDLLVWVEGESMHMCNLDGENQLVFSPFFVAKIFFYGRFLQARIMERK